MSAASAIRFRDPFALPHDYANNQRSWPSFTPRHDLNRALTPPPEMNGVSHQKPVYYRPDQHGGYTGDSIPHQQPYKAPIGNYLPQESSTAQFGRTGYATQPSSRTMSPVQQTRSFTVDDHSRQHSSRAAQANAIAPSFQIPRSVNDSGGSLSELAAQVSERRLGPFAQRDADRWQITCLFWFESSDILQQIEESTIPVFPTRQLVADAKPTTGFMKWVTTILSTTLVAQNVVLLALLFIHRLKKLNPTVRGKPGSEYRLLTVALMLGNKFLDDNTYTNKTWAEVSGINVNEVHIMEVEFLSNMKYCLFTSSEQWAQWQSLLGRFAEFFQRASKPQPRKPPAPILPPASSLHLPMALPSPPASNQASPPYAGDAGQNGLGHVQTAQSGPTPAPSPLTTLPNANAGLPNPRKRSHEEYAPEPPAKRVASGFSNYESPQPYASQQSTLPQSQQIPRLPLPSLAIPAPSQAPPASHFQPIGSQGHQLPPLNVPNRAMAMVYPNTSGQSQQGQLATSANSTSQPPSHMHSQYQSRQHSPYAGSAQVSPTNSMPPSATNLYPPAQISPSVFLQQRSSPYRPVQNVSKLLYPPPSAALQPRPQSIEYSQMHYQPLGKPFQQRQSGRLPYVAQNVWLDDNNQPHTMTPVSQSPGFNNTTQPPRPTLRQ